MRFLLVLGMLGLAMSVAAQDAPKKKKPTAKKTQQAAHKKPTPEQIRKFNELQKQK